MSTTQGLTATQVISNYYATQRTSTSANALAQGLLAGGISSQAGDISPIDRQFIAARSDRSDAQARSMGLGNYVDVYA